MSKLLAAAALTAIIASPVLAQSYDPSVGSGNIVPPPYAYVHQSRGHQAFAQAPGMMGHVPDTVEVRDSQGNVIGADPDLNIRSVLRRENWDVRY
jgi:hypothetical protein